MVRIEILLKISLKTLTLNVSLSLKFGVQTQIELLYKVNLLALHFTTDD